MTFVFERDGRYVCKVNFANRHLAEEAGFIFSNSAKEWFTSRSAVAYRRLDDCEGGLRERLLAKYAAWHPPTTRYTHRVLTHAADRLPNRNQTKGALHILNKKYSALWYEAGTGKTFTACMALEFLAKTEGKTNLVICPAFLVDTWLNELMLNTEELLVAEVVTDGKYILKGNADVVIVPDSLLNVDVYEQIINLKNLGACIIDEWHRFKNETSARTKMITERLEIDEAAFFKPFSHVCAMSGTPSPNFRPIELWSMIDSMCPQVFGFMSKEEFGLRYCEARSNGFGLQYNGCNEELVPELIGKLKKSGFLIYCELDAAQVPDAAPDTVIYVKDSIKGLDVAADELTSQLSLDQILKVGIEGNAKLKGKYNFKLAGKEYVQPAEFMAELRRLSGLSMVPEALKVIRDVLKNKEPVVIWAWHKDVVAALAKGLEKHNPIVIDGDTNPKKRQALVDGFQSGKSDVAICNIIAGGVGYTMTRSYRPFLVEFDYSEGNNDQAIRRCRRIGQNKAVMPYYFVSRQNLSGIMYDIVRTKTKLKEVYREALRKSLTGQ